MIRILRGASPIALILALTCGPRNHAPEVPATPIGPAYGLPDSTYAFSTSAIDPDGDSVAIEFLWGDTAVVERTGFVASGEPVIRNHVWHEPGVFAVKARAVDTRGRTSGWSSVVDLDVVHLDSLPLTPLRPEGADSVRVGFIEEFSFPTRGPAGESLLLKFDWGDRPVWYDWEASCHAGETVKTRQALWREGSWHVRASAYDRKMRTSSFWSAGKRTKVRFQPGSGWTEYYDAYNVNAIAPTRDGGYILGLELGWGVCLAKTDAEGNVQWMTSTDTTGASAVSIQQTADSGYVVLGSRVGFFPVMEFDLIRFDRRGVLRWIKTYYGERDWFVGRCVRQTPDGGFIVAASQLLLKTDANGDSMWARECNAMDVELVPDGGYIICGEWPMGRLTRLDASGNVIWEWHRWHTWPLSVYLLSSGDVMVAGEANLGNAYLSKVSSDGTLVWERTYPGDAVAFDVCQTTDGDFCIAGEFDWSAPYLLRTDANGALRWQREVSPDLVYGDCIAILSTPDNGCIVGSCFDDRGEVCCAALFKVDENGGIGPTGPGAGFPGGVGARGGARTVRRARAERLRAAMRGR